jgi:hypothetical protein
MLTNPIRGKAGKQITAPNPLSIGQVMYTVPVGKYFEMPNLPVGLIITANGISAPTTTAIAVPTLFQSGTIITAGTGGASGFFGTEYDA